jgi:transcriptional regulator with XRE-family HTH domain
VSPRERSRDQAIAVAFGQKVREARLAANLTQETLAEATGMHPTFISNVERGYRVPSVPTLLRLAAGLGVSPSELVDELET